MAVKESKYIKVEAYELTDRRTSSSSTYRCTISRKEADRGSHYGYCETYRCILFKRVEEINGNWGYFVMWGFPSKAKWKSSWGTQSHRLANAGSYYDIGYGYLPTNTDDVYTWEETVSISRPSNSKQGSRTIKIGNDKGRDSSSDYGPNLIDLTLYTTKIGDPYNLSISASVDDRTKKDRKIRISASFSNPESFYSGAIYEGNTKLTDGLSHTVSITKSMFGTTKTYTLIVTGKDGSKYSRSVTTSVIEASGVGVTVKKSGNPKEVQEVWYKDKNGNIREITELWVRRNSNNYETVK